MKGTLQPLAKLFYLCILIVGSVQALSAQTTIYSDDFHYSNGTTSSAKWTTITTGCNLSSGGDYFEINGNKLEAKDLDCEAIWQSTTIDISDYDDVSVEIELQESGKCESSDYMKVYYILDGGSETMFSHNGNNYDDFNKLDAEQSGLNGDSLVILVKVRNDNGSEKHRILEIEVEGTYNPTVCTSETLYSEDFNYSDGTTSSAKWTISGSSPTNYFEVRDNKFKGNDLDGEAVWSSSVIDIDGYTDLEVSVDLSSYGNEMENSDYIEVYYKLNGGSEVLLTDGEQTNDFNDVTATASGMTGTSLQIIVRADNSYHNETQIFDNVIVTGCNTDTSTTSSAAISLSIDGTDANCYGSDDGSIDLTVDNGSGGAAASGSASSGCADSPTSSNSCTSCTSTAPLSGTLNVNSGTTICIPSGQTFSGYVNMNGGTLVVCGNIIPWSLNFTSGTIIINSSIALTNLTIGSNCRMENYGSVAISGNLTVTNEFENHGTLSVSNSITVNSSASFTNTNVVAVSGSVTNKNELDNSGIMNISNALTINSNATLNNECTINVNGAVTITDSLVNNGAVNGGNSATIYSNGTLLMGPNALFSATSLTLSGDVIGSGPSCASIEISGNTTVYSQGEIGANIDLCDANGIESNNGTISGSSDCSCSATGEVPSAETYTYEWSNGATTEDLSGLAPDVYVVTVTSSGGATATESYTIEEPDAISISETVTDANCNGASDGSISLSVTGGSEEYTYTWSTGSSDSTLTSVGYNVYSVTVTDDNGCEGTKMIGVGQPDALSASASASEETSTGAGDGSVSLTVSGGTSPYSYSWSNGSSSKDISSLSADTYSVTVTDNNGCTATASAVVTALAAPTSNVTTGSFIIDMGVTPQTVENGLMPYGLVYDLLANFQVPIEWVINPSKSKDGVDFIHNSRSYSGGPFIVDAAYRNTQVDSVIAHWESEGVEIDTAVSALYVPIYKTLDGFSTLVIDEDNENIITPYFANAGIPTSVYTVGLPADLESCDDLYVLPHADPTWNDHGALYQFVRNGGYIWSGCHAVSVLEGTYNSSNSSQQLNFLSEDGLQCYKKNKCSNHISENHGDPTGPYTYDPAYDAHPVMQFMGDLTPATENGSEDVYIPLSSGQWNSGTHRAITTANGTAPNEGVKLVFGHAYNDTSFGMVMYEAGHKLNNKGTEANQVAAQRAFFNFYLLASTEMGLSIDATAPVTTFSNNSTEQFSVSVSGGTAPYSYQWTSTLSGTFSSTSASSTNFTATNITSDVSGQIVCRVTDACGKINIVSIPVEATGESIDVPCFTWLGSTSGDWTNPNNWSCGVAPTCNDSVVIPAGTSNTATITSGKTGYANHLTIESGSTIAMGSTGTLRVCGDLNVNGTLNLSNGTVIFQGDTIQRISSSNSVTVLNKVEFNNSGATGVVLKNSIHIKNTVKFSDGYVYTLADTLYLLKDDGDDATVLSYSDSSYVIGKLNRAIDRNYDDYTFPVGKADNHELMWLTIKNSNLNGIDNITCWFSDLERNNDNEINFSDEDITYMAMHPKGMWTVEPNEQPSSGKYEIRVCIDHFDGLEDNNFGVLKRPKGGYASNWNNGNGSTGLLGLVGRVLNAGYGNLKNLTGFSEFGVGTGGGSSLPIQLTQFTAEYLKEDGHVKLNWTTEVEINNDYFIVQRSIDGYHYEDVANVKGAGNSNVEIDYTAYDQDPPAGLVYYRLKQYDFDGKYQYSDIVSVMVFHTAINSVKVYPNPANSFVNIELTTDSEQINVMILDMNGNLVKMLDGEHGGGTFNSRIDLDGQLPAGQYLVKIKAGSTENIKKLMIVH